MIEHEMRRKDRQISEEEAVELLKKGEYGVLATVDGQGQPYSTPLSYVYKNGLIYIHSALNGHKIETLRQNNRVSFVVVGHTQPVYRNDFTTLYESAVVFGRMDEVLDRQEKYEALYALAEKYLPEHVDKAAHHIDKAFERTAVYALYPEKVTGKANRMKFSMD